MEEYKNPTRCGDPMKYRQLVATRRSVRSEQIRDRVKVALSISLLLAIWGSAMVLLI